MHCRKFNLLECQFENHTMEFNYYIVMTAFIIREAQTHKL